MFLSTLNLALLSCVYVGANNQLLDTSNLTKSYNQQYGCYYLEIQQEAGVEYLLRYDNNTLLYFNTDISTDYGNSIFYNVYYDEIFNFHIYLHLVDEGMPSFPTQIYDSFDTLYDNDNHFYNAYSYTYNLAQNEYSDDSMPLWSLSISLLDRQTYEMADVNESDYQSGYNDGYETGYNVGYHDGYDTGSTDGYNSGFNTGKTTGYNEGYNTALNTHHFSFTNLFASIADTPILMFRRMFSFDVFGVSAISILLSLFTALIFIKIIKRMV